jgi:hypothetical protein
MSLERNSSRMVLIFREKPFEIRVYRLIIVRTAQFCRSTNDVLMCSLSGSPLIHVLFSTKRIYPVLRVEAPRWTHPSLPGIRQHEPA